MGKKRARRGNVREKVVMTRADEDFVQEDRANEQRAFCS